MPSVARIGDPTSSGTCPAGQTCYYSLTESYCVSTQQQSLYSNMMRHNDYFTNSKEIMTILNNPKQPIQIREDGNQIIVIKDTPERDNPYQDL